MVYPAKEFKIRANDETGTESEHLYLNLAKIKDKDADKTIIWMNVRETAKLGGLSSKTIRRALDKAQIKFKIKNNRYLINLHSALSYFNSSQKLKNKLNTEGIGRWIESWRL